MDILDSVTSYWEHKRNSDFEKSMRTLGSEGLVHMLELEELFDLLREAQHQLCCM